MLFGQYKTATPGLLPEWRHTNSRAFSCLTGLEKKFQTQLDYPLGTHLTNDLPESGRPHRKSRSRKVRMSEGVVELTSEFQFPLFRLEGEMLHDRSISAPTPRQRDDVSPRIPEGAYGVETPRPSPGTTS